MTPIPDATESIKKITSLHGNMAVLSRLDSLLRDDNSNHSDWERLILSDREISSYVVKFYNSVLYCRGADKSSLNEAIQQAGFQQILKLVGMALSKQVFMKDLNAYGTSADQYWFSSYFTALFMENQAKRYGLNHADAYLIGLLHAIGKVVINELLRDNQVDIFWDSSIPAEAWEEVMVGFSYNKAGAILLENWDYPRSIFLAVENQLDAVAKVEQPMISMLDYCQCLIGRNPVDKPVETWDFEEDHAYFTNRKLNRDGILKDVSHLLDTVKQVRQTLLLL